MSRRTVTKSFGVGKRENHDASGFYLRKLCRMPLDSGTHGVVNSVPRECVDQIFVHSSETMPEVPDSSVSLMVTSPPYNVGKDYDADLSLKDYLDFLEARPVGDVQGASPGRRAAI